MERKEIMLLSWDGVRERSDQLIEEVRKASADDLDAIEAEVELLEERRAQLKEQRQSAVKAVASGSGVVIARGDGSEKRKKTMSTTIKNFKKFITAGIPKMTEEERSALALSGAGAVIPAEIYNKIITSEKYSDLLRRATIINAANAGNIKVPIMASTAATWKAENTAVSADADTLTYIELGGAELMRAIQYSAAVESMSDAEFSDWVAQNVSAEVVETLEKAFCTGAGPSAVAPAVATPHKGLSALTYTSANSVSAVSTITPADLAEGIALLPVKYSRGAVLLMNAKTALQVVGLFTGTSEYAYDLSNGATRFMGHDIVISEHIADDEVYIVDPAQLYVRFAQPILIDVDRSLGFLAASVYIRALTVVDFAWNEKAVVKVAVPAAPATT